MNKYLVALFGVGLLLVGSTAAQAQQPIANPPITPWLNLYRFGGSAAFNYNNLVRPELDIRSSVYGVQQQTRANQQAITDQTAAGPLVTGHVAGFMTQNAYFQTQGAGGASIGAASMPIARTTQPGGGAATATRGGGVALPTPSGR